MAATTAADVARALARGRRGGTFFLWGEDEYQREELVAEIVTAHLDASTRDFNYDQLRGTDLEPETLLSMCATPPMMAEWRVVVVRDVQALAANARGRGVLEQLIERAVPDLALILTAQLGDRASGKIYERLKKETVSVHLAPLGANDLPGWLIDRAGQGGVVLEPEGARALASANPELGVLAQELRKLIAYVGERARIKREDVIEIVGVVPSQNRWDWFDMVGDARFAEARAALPTLLQGSETGVGLIIGLGTHLLRVALAVAGGEKALQQSLPPNQRWLAGRVARQARAWNGARIDAALDDLLRADRLLKSASLDETQVLEELLLRLQSRTNAAAA